VNNVPYVATVELRRYAIYATKIIYGSSVAAALSTINVAAGAWISTEMAERSLIYRLCSLFRPTHFGHLCLCRVSQDL